MITNLDADILPYEIGSVTDGFRSEKRVEGMVDDLVNLILDRTKADQFELFLSDGGNYREYVASVKKYKGQRHPEKPKWFNHIRDYLREYWDATSVVGREADDQLSINQRKYLAEGVESCIASRDKDLRIVPGWHYSWPCGDYQPEKPLYWVDEIGELWPKWGKPSKTGNIPLKDLKGCGLKFFYAQMIMGDTADNIPGAPKKGAKYALEAINECTTEEEMYHRVLEAYYEAYGGEFCQYRDWRGKLQRKHTRDVIREQGILLWMQREEGEVWRPPVLNLESSS